MLQEARAAGPIELPHRMDAPEQGQWDNWPCHCCTTVEFYIIAQLSKCRCRSASGKCPCLAPHNTSVSCCFLTHEQVWSLFASAAIKLMSKCLCDPGLRTMSLTVKHQTSLSLTHTYLIDKNGQMRWGEEDGTCLKD